MSRDPEVRRGRAAVAGVTRHRSERWRSAGWMTSMTEFAAPDALAGVLEEAELQQRL